MIALATLVAGSAAVSRAESKSVLRILTENVGGAAARIRANPWRFEPECLGFKLCDPKVIRAVHDEMEKYRPDVALIQEAQGEDQLLGTTSGIPALPPGYAVECAVGAEGIREVCIAWNSARVKRAGDCQRVSAHNGGALSCPLELDGHAFTAVSVHPDAWDSANREALLKEMWTVMARHTGDAVVGGDFNTQLGTGARGDRDLATPYPADFGTLYGQHLAGYGRWAPKDTFYGEYAPLGRNGAYIPRLKNSTVFGEKLDHLFVNFGEPEAFAKGDACKGYVCMGGVDRGFSWHGSMWIAGTYWGVRRDHRPILAQISW